MSFVRGAFNIPDADYPLAKELGITGNVRDGKVLHVPSNIPMAVYPVDEPDLCMTVEEAMEYIRIAEQVEGLPSFTVLFGGIPFGQYYRPYRDVADVIGVDLYPYHHSGLLTFYSYWSDRFRLWRASRALAGRAWFGVPQAFKDQDKRMPTMAEFLEWENRFRYAGAAGVFAYNWPDGKELLTKVWSPRVKQNLAAGWVHV